MSSYPNLSTSQATPLRLLQQLRWVIARPLQTRVLPKWVPVLNFFYIKHWPFVNYGNLLLLIPLVLLFLAGYGAAFVTPSIEGSGTILTYSMIWTFLLAGKSNSIFNLLFGLSYERIVPFHQWSAVLTVLLVAFHLYVVFVYGDEASSFDKSFFGFITGRGGSNGESNDGSEGGSIDGFDDGFDGNGGGGGGGGGGHGGSGGGGGHGGGDGDDLFARGNDDRRRDDDRWDSNDENRRLSEDSIYSKLGSNTNLWKFLWDGETNTTGTLAALCMTFLVLTSFFRIFRKHYFDTWLFTHIALCLSALCFALLHGASLVVLILVWWLVDWTIRLIWKVTIRHPKTATLTKLLPDLVEVRCPRGNYEYSAGQFLKIAIPSTGSIVFHPVTISSSPFEKDLTVHYRVLGDWTSKLAHVAETNKEVSIMLEGPYGNLISDLDDAFRYPVVLAIGGGIGVTPVRSLAGQLYYAHKNGRPMRKIRMIWSVRSLDMVKVLPPPSDQYLSENAERSAGSSKNKDDPQTQPTPAPTESQKTANSASATNIATATDGTMTRGGRRPSLGEMHVSSGSLAVPNTSSTSMRNPPPGDQVPGAAASGQPTNSPPEDQEVPSNQDSSSRKKEPSVLQVDIYMSKKPDLDPEDDSLSSYNIISGRPNIDKILMEMAEEAKKAGVKQVPVICCGPHPLVASVKLACRKLSASALNCGGITFEFHEEVFDY